ncbi:MAG TPA: DMT family transporter [Verrucomicrobiae bacterium]|nr:DMT family transporter [Verrucomicrobiae bacterium]
MQMILRSRRDHIERASRSPEHTGTWLVLGLVGATAIWGWTFIAVRGAIAHYPIGGFLFLRFVVGAVALGAWAQRPGRPTPRESVPRPLARHPGDGGPGARLPRPLAVAAAGTLLLLGYLAQTQGLELGVAPGTAAMLTGLVVVFTPAWEWALQRRAPQRGTWSAVAVVVVGLALVSAPGTGTIAPSHRLFGIGLEVAAAALFALQIVVAGRLAQSGDPVRLAAGQLVVMAVLLLPLLGVLGGVPRPSPSVALAVLVTGLLASGVAFGLQTAAQRRLSPTTTALVLSLEPAFGLICGVWLADQVVGPAAWLGAALVLGGLAVAATNGRRGPARPARSGGTLGSPLPAVPPCG